MTLVSDQPNVILVQKDHTIINVLILGVILPLVDTTLINTSLHSIAVQFGAPLSTAQWIVSAYFLAAASAATLCAWLTQRIGAKQLWLGSLWVFLAGIFLSALAPGVELLIFSRVLQGIATGLLLPTMQTIVVTLIGRSKTKAALAAMSIPSVMAPIFGPLIGGMTVVLFDWRVLFLAQVPLCILAIIAASRKIPATAKSPVSPFDAMGFLLLCPALIATLYGLSKVSEPDTTLWQASLLIGMILMAAFIWHSRRKKEKSLMDFSLFKSEKLKSSCALLFFSSIAYYGGILLFPLYLIQAGHYGPNGAGLMLALHGVGTLIARYKLSWICRMWNDKAIAMAAIFIGIAGSTILIAPLAIEHPYLIAVGMILRGAGVGVLTILSMSGAYQELAPAQVAHASSLTRIVTHLGATLGATAVAGAAVLSDTTVALATGDYIRGQGMLMVSLVACGFFCQRLQKQSA